jgi:hypothetical protein
MGEPPDDGWVHYIEIDAELADKIVGVTGLPGTDAAISVVDAE